MKKISLSAFALLAGVSLLAQEQPKLTTDMTSAVRWGIKAGVNLSDLHDEGFPDAANFSSSNKTGYYAGFLVNLPLSSNIKFQPEVVYSKQGAESDIDITGPTGTSALRYKTKLGYINVPLMFQWQTASGFFVELGPQLSFLLSAKTEDKDNSSNEVDLKDQLEKFEIAGSGGIGFMSRLGLGINARYNYGFKNILKEGNANYPDAAELKNRVIQIGLFYQFGAGE